MLSKLMDWACTLQDAGLWSPFTINLEELPSRISRQPGQPLSEALVPMCQYALTSQMHRLQHFGPC